MVTLLPEDERARLAKSETAAPLPVPAFIPSNGEYTPPPQSEALARYAASITDRIAKTAKQHSVAEAAYLKTPQAMAQAFESLNESFGADHFAIEDGESDDPEAARERTNRFKTQFVFDDQVHFVRDDAQPDLFIPLTSLIEITADLLKLPHAQAFDLDQIKFLQFLKLIYLDSDTKVALLSGAPSEREEGWMLSNDMMAAARAAVNSVCGSRRLLTHAVIAPGHDGWLDEIDRVHDELKPEGWKGYCVGEPFSHSDRRYRLDDEALMYPAYEKLVKAGVKNLCIHKGILPANADEIMPGAEPFAKVDDVGKAAKDWPDLNFIIYHAGYRTVPQPTGTELDLFESTGRIDWVSDLAEIPEAYGVSNVYADIGASFAFTVLTHPRLAAGMLGTLIKGMGADKVFWGTDSVWYGSPQWQIEALRRLTMPEDLKERFGYADLGQGDGPVKEGILGRNAAPFYGVSPADYTGDGVESDMLGQINDAYQKAGGGPDHRPFGYGAP